MLPNEILTAWLTTQGRGSITRLHEKSGLSLGHIHDIKSARKRAITVATARALETGTGIKAAVWLGLAEYRGKK